MPETAEATVENEQQQAPDEATPAGDDKKQAQAVQFPEAPEDAPNGAAGQLDVLLDMEVPVTVVLGTTEIPVRRLLQLAPGAVLKLDKPIEAPADLFLRDSKFAEAEVVVVDNRFAVRIKRITGAGVTGQDAEG
jgi:flagellar motor switch protein FliN/FliY